MALTDNQLKELDKMEQEWNEKLKEEQEKEAEIESLKKLLTDKIMNNSKIKVSVFGKVFEIAIIVNTKIKPARCKMVVVDTTRFEIAGKEYKPMILDAEFDPGYSVKGNISATVEAWLRHITGTIKPEMQEEESASVDVKREQI